MRHSAVCAYIVLAISFYLVAGLLGEDRTMALAIWFIKAGFVLLAASICASFFEGRKLDS